MQLDRGTSGFLPPQTMARIGIHVCCAGSSRGLTAPVGLPSGTGELLVAVGPAAASDTDLR